VVRQALVRSAALPAGGAARHGDIVHELRTFLADAITAPAIPRHLKLSAQKFAMLPSACGTFSVQPTTVSLFSLIADDVSERLINKGPCDWWPDFYLSSRLASVAGRGRSISSVHPV
jgi:hypothetical protein